MSVRSQNAVQAGVERMAGASLGRVGRQYRRDIAPLLDAIESAKSPEGLKRALSPALAARIETTALEESLTDTLTQAAVIGKVAGTHKSKAIQR